MSLQQDTLDAMAEWSEISRLLDARRAGSSTAGDLVAGGAAGGTAVATAAATASITGARPIVWALRAMRIYIAHPILVWGLIGTLAALMICGIVLITREVAS